MKILAVADVHGKRDRLESIRQNIRTFRPDLLVVAGDLLSRKMAGHVENLLESLSLPILLVKGNADSSFFAGMVNRIPNCFDLHLNPSVVLDTPFIGVGGAVPIPFYAKVQWFEQKVLVELSRSLSADSIVVTHTPPRGSCDKVLKRFHAGSKALGNLVDQVQPKLVICGHIHEDSGVEYRGSTCVVNCSMGYGGQGVVIDLEPGNGRIETTTL